STAGTTSFFVGSAPTHVFGPQSWNYDPQTGRITMQFSAAANFEIHLEPLPPVWPGDANNDGVCDASDFYLTAAGYGKTGPARTDSGSQWRAHAPGPQWNESIAYRDTQIPLRFLDANGDGEVNLFDLTLCVAHRGRTH
ncbi:MAG: hypothetical protein RMM53_12820, partial [Bacteroidia bacterium]|nr:hypothetical protein [Bacteroidia bacterium]MDW8335089.1 hypothetical protein [Bacteroidia bacterium]